MARVLETKLGVGQVVGKVGPVWGVRMAGELAGWRLDSGRVWVNTPLGMNSTTRQHQHHCMLHAKSVCR